MPFCTNCGKKIPVDAKFCSDCGKPTGTIDNAKRKTVYEGEIRKCPNCGEVLNAFHVNCPSCGYEVRNASVSVSVKEFASQITNAVSSEDKVDLIRNYPIPNTKEDVHEFMVFASTNVKGEQNRQVFNAWVAKFEQCYKKAELLFDGREDFERISKIYDSTKRLLAKESAVHEVKATGNAIVSFFSNMENPIFGVAVVIVILANLVAMITGTFESDGTNVFYSLIILLIVYKVTGKKKTDRNKE